MSPSIRIPKVPRFSSINGDFRPGVIAWSTAIRNYKNYETIRSGGWERIIYLFFSTSLVSRVFVRKACVCSFARLVPLRPVIRATFLRCDSTYCLHRAGKVSVLDWVSGSVPNTIYKYMGTRKERSFSNCISYEHGKIGSEQDMSGKKEEVSETMPYMGAQWKKFQKLRLIWAGKEREL